MNYKVILFSSFWRTSHTVFYGDCIGLHFYQQHLIKMYFYLYSHWIIFCHFDNKRSYCCEIKTLWFWWIYVNYYTIAYVSTYFINFPVPFIEETCFFECVFLKFYHNKLYINRCIDCDFSDLFIELCARI